MLTSETREAALTRLGRALADPTRCRILVALLDGVNYPGQLATKLGLTRSNVSNHLACLRGCGLVVAVYEGRQVRYGLADPHLARALGEFVQVVLAVDAGQACADDAPAAMDGSAPPCADEMPTAGVDTGTIGRGGASVDG